MADAAEVERKERHERDGERKERKERKPAGERKKKIPAASAPVGNTSSSAGPSSIEHREKKKKKKKTGIKGDKDRKDKKRSSPKDSDKGDSKDKKKPTVTFSGPPKISADEINLLEKKGKGCFGTVWAGKCRGANVAVKIPNQQHSISQEKLQEFNKEIEIMSKIYSPNINLFMGACLDPGNVMIVTELMVGNVEQLLRSSVPLNLTTRMKMARDAAKGMAWLHGSNPRIIHRDLKSSNLLYNDNEGTYTIKVCDFGLSQLFQGAEKLQDSKYAIGSPLWMAPEVMQKEVFNEKADVYSFGIVLWECLTRKPPFPKHTDFDIFRSAVCKGERPEIPDDTIPSISSLMKRCWTADPHERPAFPEIVKALECIIVDCAIPHENGRNFWKKNYIAEEAIENPIETILWEDFIMPFYQFLESNPSPLPDDASEEALLAATPAQINEYSARSQAHFMRVFEVFEASERDMGDWDTDPIRLMEEIEWKCLKAVLVEETKDHKEVARMEKFGDIVASFGPLHLKRGGALARDGFLKRVREVLETGWFFGPLSGKGSITQLNDAKPGTFLVRYSSQPGWFSISKVSKNREIAHYRIDHAPASEEYRLEGSETAYKSLPELIKAISKQLFLSEPCSGSPYHHLFVKKEDANLASLNYTVADY